MSVFKIIILVVVFILIVIFSIETIPHRKEVGCVTTGRNCI